MSNSSLVIKFLSVTRTTKSQYIGHYQYFIEALVNGQHESGYETARTQKDAKARFTTTHYNRARFSQKGAARHAK